MKFNYKILQLEDDCLNAELAAKEFRKSEINFEQKIVNDRKNFLDAIDQFSPDIILCNHTMSLYKSTEALKDLKTRNLSIPFILIIEALSDEMYMNLLKEGVDDYISKDDIKRLPLATVNAVDRYMSKRDRKKLEEENQRLEEILTKTRDELSGKLSFVTEASGDCIAREASQKKQVDEQLLFNEQRFKDLVQGGLDLIAILDELGNYTYVSPNSIDVLGFAFEEFIGKNTFLFMHPDDKDIAIKSFSRIANEKKITVPPIRFLHKNGSWRWLESSITNFTNNPAINGIVINSRDITEKKLVEEKIILSEAHLAEAQRFAKMGSWSFDFKNDRLIWSEELYNIFGTDKKTFMETHQSFINLIDESDRAFAEKTSRHTQLTGDPFTIEYNITTHAGEKKVIQELGYGMKDSHGNIINLFGTAQDITERKKSEKELKDSERRYRQIVETAQEGIWMSDENNVTTFVNQKMCDMLEYSSEEMIGKPVWFFKDEEGQKESLLRLEKKEKRVSETHESRHITKSGKVLWTIVSTNPILNEKGEYKGGLGMFTDITKRKEQELQLAKNAEERELLISELTKSLKDLKQFSFITSHNFRAPLANLIGLLSLVDYSTLTKSNSELVEMFKASTQQLNKTINDLNQILLIKDNTNVNIIQNNIRILIDKVSQLFIFDINKAKGQISTELNVENIWFNRNYLESILINLVSNAIKFYSPDRPLQIDIITEENANGDVIMRVRDNGIGIDLERHQKSIFGLYQRFHSNTNGTGLGLFIVKSQVEAMGGTIDVQSEVDNGTTFIITFSNDSREKKADK